METKGCMDKTNVSDFNVEKYFHALKTKQLGHLLLSCKQLSSTQTVLNEYLDSIPLLVVLADRQTNGRGRGQNKWTSPEGCLLVSFCCPHTDSHTLAHFQYLVSMAVVETTKKLLGNDMGLKLKWPNDVYYKDKMKVGGAMCQAVMSGTEFRVVVGLGLNLNNDYPTTCLQAISQELSLDPGEVLTREIFLSEFFNIFEGLHEVLKQFGFDPLKGRYLKYWLHTNQEVSIRTNSKAVMVRVVGVTSSGYLLAQDLLCPSVQYELHPDTNSLNFWDGFIISKKGSQL
eukprot:TRINITY_DN9546_c0_g1_i1.p1 TRINITY_DN9546_c0_g1~~TRINITY_DN9546_c0_g1_i1.p1  ORF type:complete len:286 (+),score=41.05 TRINITY_DN9546_c0_g1_i1:204-1061(+)